VAEQRVVGTAERGEQRDREQLAFEERQRGAGEHATVGNSAPAGTNASPAARARSRAVHASLRPRGANVDGAASAAAPSAGPAATIPAARSAANAASVRGKPAYGTPWSNASSTRVAATPAASASRASRATRPTSPTAAAATSTQRWRTSVGSGDAASGSGSTQSQRTDALRSGPRIHAMTGAWYGPSMRANASASRTHSTRSISSPATGIAPKGTFTSKTNARHV
jgi:hypothetical protein